MGHASRRDRAMRRINLAALAVLLGAALFGIVTLGIEVERQFNVLARANSDSVHWALSQLEVELMRLKVQYTTPDAPPDDLRLRYDIFYARIRTIQRSPLYAGLRALPEFREPLDRMAAFLDRTADDFGPPALPGAAVPDLRADFLALLPDARRMSLVGVKFFASQSDQQRGAVADTLRRLVLLSTALVVALSTLLIVLLRLYGLSRRQSEDVRLTSARLSTIVANSADAIIVSDRHGRVLDFNPAAETMFRCSREDASSLTIRTFLPDPVAPVRESDAGTGQPLPDDAFGTFQGRAETQARRGDGSTFPVELSVAAAESADGGIVIGFLRDVSDRRQIEQDLTEARDKALAGEQAKARFLAVMSHEMRTPLNGLLGSAEVLRATPLDPDQDRLVEVIETSARILLHHVSAGLDISRIEAGAIWTEVTGFSIELLVAEVVANQTGLAAAAGNQITVVTAGAPPGRVLGNPGQVRQILLNLVGNAVKFTANGTITVEIRPGPVVGRTVEIEVRVIDSGIGIAKDDLGRVFEDYVTLDASHDRPTGGTGLGLGITQRLVRSLGGTIGVESVAGAGSVFWVRLPFVTEPDARMTARPTDAVAAPCCLSILVVDDNRINRFVLRSLLQEVGHGVTEAEDGQTAVTLAADVAFDVILMDISMPGMDGIEAARRIRDGGGLSAGARIFAVTAHARPDDRLRLLDAGIADCLTKPITRGALSALLANKPPPAPSPGRASAPLLDISMLEELAGRLGRARFSGLMHRFLAEGDAMMTRLSAGVPDGEARMLIHRLSGSAATFGAAELARQLQEAEAALDAAPPLPDGARALADLWVRTRASLATYAGAQNRVAE